MDFVWIFCICSICFYGVISIIAKIVNKVRAKKSAKAMTNKENIAQEENEKEE